MSTIVPFGKYKGQPVEALAKDSGYVEWLLSQQGIKTKYPDLIQVIINNFQEPSETPEHNALQVKFIDEAYRTKFAAYICDVTNDRVRNLLDSVKSHVEKYYNDTTVSKYDSIFREDTSGCTDDEKAKNDRIHGVKIKVRAFLEMIDGVKFVIGKVEFEKGGADVSFSSNIETIKRIRYDDPEYRVTEEYEQDFPYYHHAIEIKPVVSDDFPAVLRQMKLSGANILFLSSYTGVGATKQQFIDYFNSQRIRVVFESEINDYEFPSIDYKFEL